MTILDGLSLTGIPPEGEALRAEVRAFLQDAVKDIPAHVRAKSWSGYDPALSRKLGEKGWIGMTLPKAYGGGERSAFARYVLVEECLNFGAPVGSHWIADRQSAPLILKYGTEAQKQFYIPRVCRGEVFFCIGMSEPNAGSDLASVRTRAVPNEQGFLLNGQKIWTTNAHHCQYMIALVRTSGSAEDRHKGLSQVIVDLTLPGVTVRPIQDLSGDSHFCEVFFENVQLSADALIGAEGQGWEQVTAELAFERSGPERLFSSIVLFDQWLQYARTPQGRTESGMRLAGKGADATGTAARDVGIRAAEADPGSKSCCRSRAGQGAGHDTGADDPGGHCRGAVCPTGRGCSGGAAADAQVRHRSFSLVFLARWHA
jgi:alkylation response protein AidB-like acyl-CoA dehydrogenase